ncbi:MULTISPECIES: D-serine ammonia-lyase [unclassified Sporosarcina]|uniref:D-serine ammonia-lyase n=1 Tax=unclassified Sporosarcina TaxID=2647733 RepID=UPI00203DACC9|nr:MULTISPECIES: D-serine ammonia-lyase [unclassified Sporosarcina]GKV66384.1 putative D-serine dehydratase [Sporosarcina sp. NCCP-2331]GLB56501.1 putative D-serine dehydratase [Sporosarcina sp. NCCP-2378]
MNDQNRKAWLEKEPLLQQVAEMKEVLWRNPSVQPVNRAMEKTSLTREEVEDARQRLERFAPYLEKVFPDTAVNRGIIESPLTSIPAMKRMLEQQYKLKIAGMLMLKQDNALPISGSIKARGGIYEVLKHAETLALDHQLVNDTQDYRQFAEPVFKSLFAQHKIAVGSTGNLGLSIGIMSAKLGFNVTVHMSSDAKQWKKDLLRSKGVEVIEYEDDYSKAVEEGRRQAQEDPFCHFIDDENSTDLFMGYAVAGERVAAQLKALHIKVDREHPLFVYLPCGVGGGPGGVAFGLKLALGDHVHCFFAEPTHSPCMMIGMATGLHDQVSVADFHLDNKTAADGLAVGTASAFVGKTMEPFLAGCYSVADHTLFKLLKNLADSEDIWLEPSALAGMTGPVKVIESHVPEADSEEAVHLVWGTGGNMVPEEEMQSYYDQAGKQ